MKNSLSNHQINSKWHQTSCVVLVTCIYAMDHFGSLQNVKTNQINFETCSQNIRLNPRPIFNALLIPSVANNEQNECGLSTFFWWPMTAGVN